MAQRRARGEAKDDDVKGWWAEIASSRRPEPMEHKADVFALAGQAASRSD